ncbi:acyltransferase 3 [Afipia carboxidovorans OM5]|uniref:Putative acyltransferase n=1 Tax=Afipia carboxidovorans (strain ATCC 49405 / DSM 1227 / KCTC 32145 / OM5) TaxID=504832 RepID=B6JGS0_AFIC5|nr:acyltransferase family protein [Afipia carboxidovorans]ACI93004.1 acyltransferase 3 [Afipia carboxidovorans OM5]AEI03265.1 putative acyltransferase [Afipia carboxidovorans OM4]AEI06842.1 putative acyltransferase [Afipia carboxidovorans OM5]
MSLPYRRDVDGLRAIAVLFVIGFHYFPSAFPGGFVGVDVFFVISGFLITGLIRQDIAADRFSIAQFYGRRIRRIFPALILVLLVALGMGFLFMLPDAFRTLGLNVAASAGFVANIALWLQQDYFAQSAEFNPLLHIWSLGVEEQFYLVWPLILMMLAVRRSAIPVAVGLAGLSFVVNVVQSGNDPVSAFFLPFSRFWELGAGAVLALLHARAGRPVLEREWAGWVGLLLLAVAMVVIDRDRAFPGWWALLPVAGATLLIAAGENARPNRVFLSQPALVYIGLISYPLYLWHWLLLVFARIIRFQKEPTFIMSIGLILAAGVLAHLTYRFVERPIRSAGRLSPKAVSLAAVLAVGGGLGLVVYAKEGLLDRFPHEIQKRMMTTEKESEDAHVCRYDVDVRPSPQCEGEGPAGAPLALVWGDSHAFHLIAGLRALQQERQDFRLARYISFACAPMVDAVASRPRYCNDANAFARQKIELLRPDTVILAARWSAYDGTRGYALLNEERLTRTLEWLKTIGVQHIVVIGQFPHWKLAPSVIPLRDFQFSIFNRPALTEKMPEWDSAYLDVPAFAAEKMVRHVATAEGATFISPAATLCDGDRCLITVPDSGGLPISRDDGHLTPAASTFFIARNASVIRPEYRKETPPR